MSFPSPIINSNPGNSGGGAVVVSDVILATAGYDHSIRLWKVVSSPPTCYAVMQHNESQVNALAISPDRTTLSAAGNPHVRVYDLMIMSRNTNGNNNSGNNNMVVTSATGGQPMQILSLDLTNPNAANNGTMVRDSNGITEEEQRRNVVAIAYHDSSILMGVSDHGDVCLWDLRAQSQNLNNGHHGNIITTINRPISKAQLVIQSNNAINGNALSGVFINAPQMQVLYSLENGNLRLYDFKLNKVIAEWNDLLSSFAEANMEDEEYFTATALMPNQENVYAGTNKGYLYQIMGSNTINRMPHRHESYVIKLCISPDQQWLLSTGADGIAKLYSLAGLENNEGAEPQGEDDQSKGQEAETEGTKPSLQPEVIIRTLRGHEKWVWDGTFSADSAYCLTASTDSTAKLWDVQEGTLVATYAGQHSKGITCVALNDYPL